MPGTPGTMLGLFNLSTQRRGGAYLTRGICVKSALSVPQLRVTRPKSAAICYIYISTKEISVKGQQSMRRRLSRLKRSPQRHFNKLNFWAITSGSGERVFSARRVLLVHHHPTWTRTRMQDRREAFGKWLPLRICNDMQY
ncbi:uncharacterized protein LOC111261741 isoform X1 [Varroa jacobsoni]|uniref:uncharacterized protein LOC111261741 isoform X1 n=1 Tax=Varroa jacobsoni TaxID=62625 RepID=UPI000BF782DD|nr:uncharacterized protein LOC111261741 isoform X1 [Varroa jacobsoni]